MDDFKKTYEDDEVVRYELGDIPTEDVYEGQEDISTEGAYVEQEDISTESTYLEQEDGDIFGSDVVIPTPIIEEVKIVEEPFYTEHKKKKRKGFSRITAAILIFCLIGLSAGVGVGIGTVVGSSGAVGGVVNFMQTSGNISYTGDSISPGIAIAKKVAPAVVSMQVDSTVQSLWGQAYSATSVGSGVIFSADGYIVTNYHVVEGAKSVRVTLADGTEYVGTVIGGDKQTDLAVVKIDGKNLPFAIFGDSSKLEVGELAIAIGTPLGTNFPGSVTQGIISGLNRNISVNDKAMSLIQTDAAINQGNSGGALVNANGEVIGINSSKVVSTETEGMGFAIPITEAKPIIEQLISQKKIARPYLGITGGTITAEDAKKYGIPQGVYIESLVEGAGAQVAGIEEGDIILSINDVAVKTIEELQAQVAKYKVGEKVKVKVFGVYNREREVTITLSETTN